VRLEGSVVCKGAKIGEKCVLSVCDIGSGFEVIGSTHAKNESFD
jgi:hypothetical protein